MKRNLIKLKFNLLACLIAFPLFGLHASTYTHNQKITKLYKVNKEAVVYIKNKYGKVHISNWEKDSIKIEIELSIKSSSYTRVNKLKENIDFDFVKTKYNLTASTVFGSRYNSLFSDLKSLAESLVPTDNQVTIDYLVHAPAWANLNIENKFGDVFMDDAYGEIYINLSNGELKANKLAGQSYITINSGGADITSIANGKLTVNYANLHVKSAVDLDLTSKTSTVYLNDIDYLKLDSKRDKYHITSLNRTLGDTYFSDINISELNKELSYDMKYGNLNLDHISKSISLINISSEYADVDLIFGRNMTYNFDMTHYNEVSFFYPKEISNLQEKLIDEEKQEYLVYGTIGNSEAKEAKVNIKAFKKCIIKIEHK